MTGPERCGAGAPGFKITCDLEKGHVKGSSDWHQGAADTKSTQEASTWEFTVTLREMVRWAPAFFELPRTGEVTP